MKNKLLGIFFLFFTSYAIAQTPIAFQPSSLRHGPEYGSLLIIGGGKIPIEIWDKFTELAGGKDVAKVVVISAAAGDSLAMDDRHVEAIKNATGIQQVVLMHTKDLAVANSDEFVAPLRDATGVFFVGGRQWRIADSYLNTKTHQEFFRVLERGGVIAGTSAGASIQGSLLWRGDTAGPHILLGDHLQGLGFLRNSAIDQHLLKRNRQFDLVETIRGNPELLGIGLDESTAVLVQKDQLLVLGDSYVAIYDHSQIVGNKTKIIDGKEDYRFSNGPFILLGKGNLYDLKQREVISK